jgi:hypothetical protein
MKGRYVAVADGLPQGHDLSEGLDHVKQSIITGKKKMKLKALWAKRRTLIIEQYARDKENEDFHKFRAAIHTIFDREHDHLTGMAKVEEYTDSVKTPEALNNQVLDWDGLEHCDEIEKWVYERSITARVPLNGDIKEVEVEIRRLKVKGSDVDTIVPLIHIPEGVADHLYPGADDSEERFIQAVFYTRAVMKILEAMDVSPEIFQVHEARGPLQE